jgi:hypothetical protein
MAKQEEAEEAARDAVQAAAAQAAPAAAAQGAEVNRDMEGLELEPATGTFTLSGMFRSRRQG